MIARLNGIKSRYDYTDFSFFEIENTEERGKTHRRER